MPAQPLPPPMGGPRGQRLANAAPRPALRYARSRAGALALATLLLATIISMGLVPAIWFADTETQLSRLTETAVIGLCIVCADALADRMVDRGVPRVPAYLVAVVAGALVGTVLGWNIREGLGLQFGGQGHVMNPVHRYTHPLEMVVFSVLVGGLATFVHVNRRTALAARRRQHEAERARALAQRQTLESQLQALQARVEPRFLFGTLERIQQLYRNDVSAAGAMLEDLIHFLRAALPHLRESSSTAGQEALLAQFWSSIVGRSAMGGWEVEVEIDDAVRDARMPALLLLPLVQCATGDRGDANLQLRVALRRHDERLQIEVWTSTPAFNGGVEGAPAIAQLRDRLDALFGPQAAWSCGPVSGTGGGRCCIALPFERADEPTREAPR